MFNSGLSVLVHLFILFLALSKSLVELIVEKRRSGIFKFKMNLYLGSKVLGLLTSQTGDTVLRRMFSYLIIFIVSFSIVSTAIIVVKSALGPNSNMTLAANMLKDKFAFGKRQTKAGVE